MPPGRTMAKKKTTISVIKADIGSCPGHVVVHPHLEDVACGFLQEAKDDGLINDFRVTHCGDDLELIMSHRRGVDSEEIHKLAWKTFEDGTKHAKSLKLYGAGQDLLIAVFLVFNKTDYLGKRSNRAFQVLIKKRHN